MTEILSSHQSWVLVKTVIEDTAMMASTEPNFTTHSFRGNEGAVLFGSVTAKYSISGNNRPMGVLILWWAMKRISLASTHDPICVEKGGEENTLMYSYLQITVCMSPGRLRGELGVRAIFFAQSNSTTFLHMWSFLVGYYFTYPPTTPTIQKIIFLVVRALVFVSIAR